MRYLMLVTLLLGCSSVDLDKDFMKPIDANVFENLVQFKCGDQEWQQGLGLGSCQLLPEGQFIEFKVKVPPTRGQVVAKSCQNHEEVDFDEDNFVSFKWDIDEDCPIAIATAGEDAGIQLFKLYPKVLHRTQMGMTMKYWSYEQGKMIEVKGIATNQSPEGTEMVVAFQFKSKGDYMISSGCPTQDPTSGSAEGSLKIRVRGDRSNCLLAIGVRYDDGEKDEAEIFLSFFDAKYIPLTKAVFGEKQVCAPLGAMFFEHGDKQYSAKRKSCRKIKGDYAIGWTKIGRMSYSEKK